MYRIPLTSGARAAEATDGRCKPLGRKDAGPTRSFRAALPAFAALAAFGFISCVASPAPRPQAPIEAMPKLSAEPDLPAGAAAAKRAAAVAVAELESKAEEAFALNRTAEGMRLYVAAMGRAHKAELTEALERLRGKAEALAATFSIEAHESWIAGDGTQVVGELRALARAQGLMPAAYLYQSYGSAKSPVADATLRFTAVANEAGLTASVSTDAKGLANASVSSVANVNQALVIRAYPVFSAEGFSFAVSSVYRDFVYAPPPKKAIVAALERSPTGYRDGPGALDAVAAGLRALGVDAKPLGASLAPERFMAAFGGDRTTLGSIAQGSDAGYYALAYLEIGPASQMQYQGRVYNIFIAEASYALRILRTDGSLAHTLAARGLRGQGGSERGAFDDAMHKAREALAEAMKAQASAIASALSR